MGRGELGTPRAKFHKRDDVVALFEGREAPDALAKSAWWYFASITTAGGAVELEDVRGRVLSMLAKLEYSECSVSEGEQVLVDEALLEDLARLWPAIADSA